MKDQIEALHRLQVQDRRLASIERKLVAIPRRKKEMARDLEKLEAMLQSELDRLDESRAFRQEQDRQLQEERDSLRGSKQRIAQVKTPRELSAAQRELEATKRMANTREEKILGLDEAIADAQSRVKVMEDGLNELRDSLNAERERLDKLEAKKTRSYKKATKNRSSLIEKIDTPVMRRYERIRKRGGGIGFVAVKNRRCSACKMAVPHQTYVSLRAAEIIPLCENCGRMLYWGGLFPDDDGKSSEPKPKSAPGT